MKSPSRQPRPYRQTARAEAADATARRILDAFGDFVRERWFEEITLDEVAERAGVTVRTVVRRFHSKAGLVAAFFEHVAPKVRLQRAVEAGDIDGALDRVLQVYEEMGDSAIRHLAQEPRYPALGTLLEGGRREHRAITAASFEPFLRPLGARQQRLVLDALIVATDVYTWKLLRRDMGRSLGETRLVMLHLVRGALAQVSQQKRLRRVVT